MNAQLALGEIRREKALQKLKTKTPVNIVVEGESDTLALVRSCEGDLRAAVSAHSFEFRSGQSLAFIVSAAEFVEPRQEPRA